MALVNYRQNRTNITASSSPTLTREQVRNDPASLTTLISRPVLLDVDVLLASLRAGAAAEDARPVDRVVVAEFLVSCDVDTAVVYFSQGAQPQGGQRGDLHHQERVAPERAGSE